MKLTYKIIAVFFSSLLMLSCIGGISSFFNASQTEIFSFKGLTMEYERGGEISSQNSYDTGAAFNYQLPGNKMAMMSVDYGYSARTENITADQFRQDCDSLIDDMIQTAASDNGAEVTYMGEMVINTDSVGNFYARKDYKISINGIKAFAQLTLRDKKGYRMSVYMIAETPELIEKLDSVESKIDFN